MSPLLKSKPISVDTFTFTLEPQSGACRDLVIKHRHSGATFEVERGDILELIQGLQAAYFSR